MIDALDTVTAVVDMFVLARLVGKRFAPALRWLAATAIGCAWESSAQALESARLDIADARLRRQLRRMR